MTSTPTRQPTSLPTPPTHPAHKLLARAHSPTTAAELFTSKVKQKPLLLRATSPPSSSNTTSRALRRHIRLRKKEYFLRKQKPRPLSAKQKRLLGVHELKKSECKYAIYTGLHRLWVGYISEVLGLHTTTPASGKPKTISAQSHGSLLASADFHGAELTVVRCGNVDRVGLSGIVVRDTKFTFVLVTVKDEVKTIPKKDTVFRFEIPMPMPMPIPGRDDDDRTSEVALEAQEPPSTITPSETKNFVFELHGNQFEVRPADRAKKQFKWKATDYL